MLAKTIRIEIYSDLICPWCYIGQHRLHAGLKLLGGGFRSDIIWRPFQLNPDMPKQGMDRKAYRRLKFGSWERSQALDSGVAATGESLGLEFNYDRVRVTPNTLAGHRLLWWARAQDRQDALAMALFFAYFTEGKDIGQAEVLAETAAVVGLDPLKAVTFLESEEGLQEVAEEEAAARRSGLNGVPFFIINDTPAFSGAQKPQAFLEAFRYAMGGDDRQRGAESCET
jgi:predicted DsbA family dithiol-disulfide isomerase